jgi:hypothetical protein
MLPAPGEDMAEPALIEIDKVCKSFDGGATSAVRDATIGSGRCLYRGRGASSPQDLTTLKFINRLVEPDSGEVRIEACGRHHRCAGRCAAGSAMCSRARQPVSAYAGR